MSDDDAPAGRPLVGLFAVFGLLLVVAVGLFVWQQARWTFAAPLAVAFQEHAVDDGNTSIRHAAIRKFIALDLLAAGELAGSAGFDCKALKIGRSLALCYRDVWTGLCKELWSLELIYDGKNKIKQATGRKRRVCLWR